MITFLLGGEKMYTNRLINEHSPYLKQHAHNPVDWYPWSKEAFLKAKREDKPIFLSIGYSTCHWCHVMERESFENEDIAKILNENFISIKVDREEMPQIDKYYQDVFYLMRKRAGGWPLTIIMTPDKGVFYADTYIPPTDRYSRPGLKRILLYLLEVYKKEKGKILKSSESIRKAMENLQIAKTKDEKIDDNIAKLYVKRIFENFDKKYKGIGKAPKFPHACALDTLLEIYKIDKNEKALNIALETLKAMAKGGIYDQIEGGFFRYSVDERWMIPHFEKMLYTNASLIEVYSKAYNITKNPLFERVVRESIANIFERFRKEGLFFSASDADSDGEEGKYFVFLYEDALKDLIEGGFDKKNAKKILKYFGITLMGNFEDYQSNPHISSNENLSKEEFKKAKEILKKNRAKKSYPFIDYKILTSWNALMIKALFEAGKYIDEIYSKEALISLNSLLKHLYKNEILYHQMVFSKPLKIKALLEDYSFLISALIEAYEYNFDENYLNLALKFTNEALEKFYKGRWYLSDDDFKTLAAMEDSSYRSSASVMIENLLILSSLKENLNFYEKAKEMLKENASFINSYPSAYPTLVKIYLEDKIKIVTIKSSKENLSKIDRKKIKRPFVYLLSFDSKNYMACYVDSCFAFGDSFEEIEDKLNSF